MDFVWWLLGIAIFLIRLSLTKENAKSIMEHSLSIDSLRGDSHEKTADLSLHHR